MVSEQQDDQVQGDDTKQVERLKLHLLELDKELEEESIRHEKERSQLMSKIKELEEKLAGSIQCNDDHMGTEDVELLRKKVDEQSHQIKNLQSSLDLLQSSTYSD